MENCGLVKLMFWMWCSEADLPTYLHRIFAGMIFITITSTQYETFYLEIMPALFNFVNGCNLG
jgi:hypothetical protein